MYVILIYMKHISRWKSEIGMLEITSDGQGITGVSYSDEREELASDDPIIKETIHQLDEYFQGKRKEFDVPLSLHGTPFQTHVWEALRTIRYGETCSYQQIASMVGNEKAVRAVGMANHVNPAVIIIPCHRVIGKNGSMVGYAGGIDKKKYLLELESR